MGRDLFLSKSVAAHDLTVAEVGAAKSETPSDAELLAAFDAKGGESGDLFTHTTPLGHVVKGVVVAGAVYRDRQPIVYGAEPLDPLVFDPLTEFEVITDGDYQSISTNAAGNAFKVGSYSGAAGGGGGAGGAEVDTLQTVTARGSISNGDIEIPPGSRLIMTDGGGERIAVTIHANDGVETNPA